MNSGAQGNLAVVLGPNLAFSRCVVAKSTEHRVLGVGPQHCLERPRAASGH